MCPKKRFYHHKNVWTVSIVKFEFLGYNVANTAQAGSPSKSQSTEGFLLTRMVTLYFHFKQFPLISASALFHLIPGAFGLDELIPEKYLTIALAIFGGAYLFFIIERLLRFAMVIRSVMFDCMKYGL